MLSRVYVGLWLSAIVLIVVKSPSFSIIVADNNLIVHFAFLLHSVFSVDTVLDANKDPLSRLY